MDGLRFGLYIKGVELENTVKLVVLDHLASVFTLVTRIAATSNRKSLATAIATQKKKCDSEKHPLALRFHCDFSAGKACDFEIVIGNR